MFPGRRFLSTMPIGLLAVLACGAGRAWALPVNEVEPNDTVATAQNVDGNFSLEANANITDSTTIPHLTVAGSGDGTFDYYSFSVLDDSLRAIFDIDTTFPFPPFGTFDPMLFLYAADGTLLASNDNVGVPDAGSTQGTDPYIDYTFASAGTYIIGVAESGALGLPGGIVGNAPDAGDFYTLNISVTGVPEPTTIALFGAGCATLMVYRRRRRNSLSVDEAV